MNERIEEELDKQFPKGDKARGRALMLHSIAQIEFEDLQKAYDIAGFAQLTLFAQFLVGLHNFQ